MKQTEEDKQEILSAISALKIRYYLGSANKCSKCNKDGSFGSIVNFITESNKKYQLCGWCGNVELLERLGE